MLYDNPLSGNCYKARLILNMLGIEFERRELSVVDHSDRAGVLGGLSPSLNVPTVVLEDGRPLAESNAILWYLADGSCYLPDDPFERAQVLQWMFFEQYKHEPGITVVRFWVAISTAPRPAADIEVRGGGGRAALDVMERHLASREYFGGERFTIADIASTPMPTWHPRAASISSRIRRCAPSGMRKIRTERRFDNLVANEPAPLMPPQSFIGSRTPCNAQP